MGITLRQILSVMPDDPFRELPKEDKRSCEAFSYLDISVLVRITLRHSLMSKCVLLGTRGEMRKGLTKGLHKHKSCGWF